MRFRRVRALRGMVAVAVCGLALATVMAQSTHAGAAGTVVAVNHEAEPGVCATCQPPLLPNDRFVMGTDTAPGAITITPIYWTPAGYDFSSDPTYPTIVNQYLTDLAASNGSQNAVGVTAEYTNGAGKKLTYGITASTPITDTNAYPATDPACTFAAPYTACVTDAQLQTELTNVIAANTLPADTSHLYLVLFPPNVLGYDGTGFSCAAYLGYHSGFQLPNNGGTVLYGNEPYLSCGNTGQQPNGDANADAEVDTISHEVSEAITDPLSGPGQGGYVDKSGNEIGDECGSDYGPPLGYVDNDPNGTTGYNQVLNGHYYYTQGEFSNAAYAANGVGKGCVKAPFAPGGVTTAGQVGTASTRVQPSIGPSMVTLDASPLELPADGSSTSAVTITALDARGEPVAGDHMLVFARDDVATPGACGTVSSTSPTATTNPKTPGYIRDVTDSNGQVTVTYTASTASADCYVLATDQEQGTTNQVLLYQGADESTAPTVSQELPESIRIGRPVMFTAQADNPSAHTIGDARFDVFLSGDDRNATGLRANQVILFYKDADTGNRFVRVPLDGTTAGDGEIDGFIVPDKARALPAGGSRTVTFQLWILGTAPTTMQTGSPLQIETDLDQFNPADASQSNLDYAGPDDVAVTR